MELKNLCDNNQMTITKPNSEIAFALLHIQRIAFDSDENLFEI